MLLEGVLVVLLSASLYLAARILDVRATLIKVLHVPHDVEVRLQVIRSWARAYVLSIGCRGAVAAHSTHRHGVEGRGPSRVNGLYRLLVQVPFVVVLARAKCARRCSRGQSRVSLAFVDEGHGYLFVC